MRWDAFLFDLANRTLPEPGGQVVHAGSSGG